MAKTRQFRPVIAGTDVSRIITALDTHARVVHATDEAGSMAAARLARRLERSWARWRDRNAARRCGDETAHIRAEEA